MMQTVPKTLQTVPPLLKKNRNQLLCRYKEVITLSEKLSCMIADFLIKDNAIAQKDYEIYKYGFELLVYNLEQAILLLVLGMFMKQLWITVVFLGVFTSLRRYTGGYHANTRVECTAATAGFYMAVLVLVVLVQYFIYRPGIVASYILFYWIVFFRYVPVEHKDKPMSDGQKKRNRKKALILSVVYMVIALLIYSYSDIVGYAIVVTMFITAVSVIIQRKRRIEGND